MNTVDAVIKELHKYSGGNRHTGKKYMGSLNAQWDDRIYHTKIKPVHVLTIFWDYGIIKEDKSKVVIDKQKKLEFSFKDKQEQMRVFMLYAKHLEIFKKENNIPNYKLGHIIHKWERNYDIT